MTGDNGENSDFELYTEKVVLNPRVKYKKLIRIVRIIVIIIWILAAIILLYKLFWPKIKAKIIEKNTEVIYIEKDDYEDYFDDQYSEDDIPDIGDDYDSALNNLKSMVDACKSSVVTIDYKYNDLESELGDNSANQMPGVIVGHVNSEYLIITSASVRDKNDKDVELVVNFSDSSQVVLSQVYTLEELGLSLYKFSDSAISVNIRNSLKVATLGNSYVLDQGDMLIFVGKLHSSVDTINYCTITSLSTKIDVDHNFEILETNVAKTSGDYGFLYNSSGALVGITYESEDATVKALGLSDLKWIIEEMINNQGVMYCGIEGQNITDELAEKYSLPTGVYISSVEIDSPAYLAGLQAGDVIVEVDGKSLLTIQEFSEKLYQKSDGNVMEITVKRKGKDSLQMITFDVTVKRK
ncbi:S1C family serine protease [Lachnospira pectinoschiza]|uniref:Serine protease, S1-C subfamily, contains C-terminal PDZ domain n=1 Tax=Lachnospira pectinoschiza TaxID=28052 RepID=A0A1G9XQ24_9FIRM|nr:PDZ domain-containing protein [Lachnospira pectinoschiza]SDM98877.1 serine protease, S1-C subfamily, contains C-terminal PDZ domain [Lachnospira pectinoschiza]